MTQIERGKVQPFPCSASGRSQISAARPGPEIAERALDRLRARCSLAAAPGSRFPFAELTPRESEVFELVAQGLDNSSIGARLGISERTARNHVSIILGKLALSSRAQAIVQAREAGFGRRSSS
jgi:DNA-binding NarL/FixJ family response regulator